MTFLYNWNLPVVVLFFITITASVSGSIYKADYVKRRLKNDSEFYLINSGMCLTAAFLFFSFGGFLFKMSSFTLLLGLLFGVATMFFYVVYSMALKAGPFGYTTMITNFSTGITALSGAIFWNEKIGVLKIVGIVLMLVSFYFSVDTKKDDNTKKASIKWFILSLITLMFCALIGIMQKIQQTSGYSGERNSFLLVAFGVSAILSALIWLLKMKREINLNTYVSSKDGGKSGSNSKRVVFSLILLMIVCGACSFVNNDINLYLAGVVDAAIFFPVLNGTALMVSIIVSFVFFKEKLAKKQWVGLIVGIMAIIALFL